MYDFHPLWRRRQAAPLEFYACEEVLPMPDFKVVSPYEPAGDQPEAIAALAAGIENGLSEQALLGVTGSGKTFTMAKVIEKVQKPTLVLAHASL